MDIHPRTAFGKPHRIGRLAAVIITGLLLANCQGIVAKVEPTSVPIRKMTVRSLGGEVEIQGQGVFEAHAPVDEEQISFGTMIRTGSDGRLLMESDDGTIALISPDSQFKLVVLEGDPEKPLTRLRADYGNVSVFRLKSPPLPAGSGFEIQTPGATMAIRGSSMGVRYSDSTGSTTFVCVTGFCESAGTEGQTAVLSGGQMVEIDSGGTAGPVSPLSEEDLQRQMDALQAVEDSGTERLSVDISECNNELGGRTAISAGREYIAITRPGCWATPEEAWENKNSVAVSLSLDDKPLDFIGFGPTCECTPGGNPTGTYNFGAYFVVGPFQPGDYTVAAVHTHSDGYINNEICVLEVR